MAKKRSASDGPPKKATTRRKKAKATKASKKKKPAKKRRPRSRGKARNPRTKGLNAATEIEQAAGIKHQNQDVVRHNVPPEDFTAGPSVSLLDGNEQRLSREAALIHEILAHKSWNIPEQAFAHIPNKLTQISMNAMPDPENPTKMIADEGDWSTNQQLTAMRILERLHHNNLQKLVAVKPQEVRILHEQSTVITTNEQRIAVLAAIASELERRQSRGTIQDQPDRNGSKPTGAGSEGDASEPTGDEA